MRVLVTGGTGVIGKATVDRLVARGHTVRLFSRHAEHDSGEWPAGVEPYDGDIGSDASVRGSAEGCDAILHIVGIVEESPPELTFENVNVRGTQRIVDEARRAGVRRLVYVSSLGADVGESDYHRSKRQGEQLVQQYEGNWLIVRPGNVYGPGDEVISLLLKMVRVLPVLPVIRGGDRPFQPVWAEDLGELLALALERDEPARAVLEAAGEERVTMDELVDLLAEITDKRPLRVPVPAFLAQFGAGVGERLGVALPINAGQITILREGNTIDPPTTNALTAVFGLTPTPLRVGLAKLADALPENLPSEGTGELRRERFWADVRGSRLDADALFELVRTRFYELQPPGLVQVGAEPGTPLTLDEGETLTLSVPLRGHVQVRCVEIADRAITLATVEGHFLAGTIRFLVLTPETAPHPADVPPAGTVRFEVRSYSRAASPLDWLGMHTVGTAAQVFNWSSMVRAVVERSGGEALDGVQTEITTLSGDDAREVEDWAEALVRKRHREDAPRAGEAQPEAGSP